MASILVYIEPAGYPVAAGPSQASLEILGEARRMADVLGATVYAFAPMWTDSNAGLAAGVPDIRASDALIDALGHGGADRVMLVPVAAPVSGPPGWPAGWAAHGQALCAAYEQVQPLLVLLAATRAGRDLGPRLAARAQAVFVSEPALHGGPGGDVILCQSTHGNALRRRLSIESLERPAVVTLPPGTYSPAHGADEPATMLQSLAPAPGTGIEYLGSDADPGADLDTARVIVVAGAGVDTAATHGLVSDLAAALGAALGATPALCARGLAPRHQAIGVGARHVAPALYVVCAASGSPAHLGAVSPDATIIAINADPAAPVFRVASYGIVGRLEQVIPDLIAALAGHPPAAVPQ